jgi:hypothetical protein
MDSLLSLQSSFSDHEIRAISKKWIDSYSHYDTDDSLFSQFKKFFGMKPSFFSIENPRVAINELASQYYHNEAFIKSSFIKKELLKGKQVTFYEFPINDSRADLCRVNSKSYAYEIKTKYDNLDRLSKQLSDYLLAFEYVYVVCSLDKKDDVLSILPNEVGLFTYDDSKKNVTFVETKKATSSTKIDSAVQFNSLSFSSKRMLTKKLEEITPDRQDEYINQMFKTEIKSRYEKNWRYLKANINKIQPLDWQFYFKNCD